MIKVFLLIIFLILVGNIFLLNFFFVSQRNDLLELRGKVSQINQLSSQVSQQSFPEVQSPTICPQSCTTAINTAVANFKPQTGSLIAPVVQNTTLNQKGEYFIPLGTGSVNSNTDWTDINSAQATFDAGNYPSIKAAYFEVFLHVNSGEVSARLFDATTPAIFFGSELKTSLGSSTFLSAPISLKPGQKTYRVQMSSTVSSGYLDQARIRIVTQ